jgi:peroxiredoxin (alkyl hydroperoxide reductase subunit C)
MKKVYSLLVAILIGLIVFGQMPMLGDKAPKFEAKSTKGDISFPGDYYGKWKILFSHPADFTPVCTTEIIELSFLQDEFKKQNTQLVVLSTDGLNSHLEWVKSMEAITYKDKDAVKIEFPIVSDVGLDISKQYGMIHPNSSSTHDVRAVFIINPDDKICLILYYPDNVGRNIDEILRTLIALQEVDKNDRLAPANWQIGDDLMLNTPVSQEDAKKLESKKNLYSIAWYLWFEKE